MKKRKFLTRHEINAILEKARQGRHAERDYCMILMCFIHGFRVSELCNLMLSDLDLNSGIIHVRRLKGGLSTTHPLVPEEIDALNQWFNIRRQWRESDTSWVFFITKIRRYFTPASLWFIKALWQTSIS